MSDQAHQPQELSPDSFGSNAIRLAYREWLVVLVLVLVIGASIPRCWLLLEPFEPAADYRVPYALSEDYWTCERLIQASRRQGRIVMIGDSVVWGEYVTPQGTLTHYLNQQADWQQFANGGLNGSHPLALSGLVRYYTPGLRGRPVVLHCNLLWMSSVERDLQTDKEISFNHPGLVPQFSPWIPCYLASVETRLGVLIDRHSLLRNWVRHLRIRSFDNLDVPSWSLEHPYVNPFSQLQAGHVRPLDEPHSPAIPWTARGIPVQDIPWVELEASLQWRGFCETVRLLKQRSSRLFVLVGPFNEHLLTEASQQRYAVLKRGVEAWLAAQQVPYSAPAALPSTHYGDASHPLAAGYAQLAAAMYQNSTFRRWLERED